MNVSILLAGLLIIVTLGIRPFLRNKNFPELVAYIALGFAVRIVNGFLPFLTQESWEIFEFLAYIGVIALLFRVGLESNIMGLANQLKKSSLIVAVNVSFSGLLGYCAARFLLGYGILPSLFVGAALVATSVGVSTGVWQEVKALKTAQGELLLDLAELDDILGVLFMAILFSIAPLFRGSHESLFAALSTSVGSTIIKLLIFVFICFIFAKFLEKPLIGFLKRNEPSRDKILIIFGLGFIIASLAGLLGFSVAIGAFFAGLAFSRDPEAVKTDRSFSIIYDLFYPFFFINIGLKIDPQRLIGGFQVGVILIVVAIIGKFIGTYVPVWLQENRKAALLLGVSMIPRAEVALIIMQQGVMWGAWAVTQETYSAMTLVTAATCIITPLILHPLLKRQVS